MRKEQPDIKTLSLSEFKIDIRWKAHLNLRKLRPIKNLIFKAALALARSLLRIYFVVVVVLSAVHRKKATNVNLIVKMIVG